MKHPNTILNPSPSPRILPAIAHPNTHPEIGAAHTRNPNPTSINTAENSNIKGPKTNV
jgi:hypothetical protein